MRFAQRSDMVLDRIRHMDFHDAGASDNLYCARPLDQDVISSLLANAFPMPEEANIDGMYRPS